MSRRTLVALALPALFLGACPEPEAPRDAVPPERGDAGESPVDCRSAWSEPDELLGPDGLGRFGWTWEDLRLRSRWQVDVAFPTRWISDNDDSDASTRVRPELAPRAGFCVQQRLEAAGDSLASGLAALTPFAHRKDGFDALVEDTYTPPAYPSLAEGNPLARALRGLAALPNPLPGAPMEAAVAEPPEEPEAFELAAGAWPPAAQEALARLVLALGEVHHGKVRSLRDADLAAMAEIHRKTLEQSYATGNNMSVNPISDGILDDLLAHADSWDDDALFAPAVGLADALDAARRALADLAPFEGGDLDVPTPHGRVILRSSGADDTHDRLGDAALIVDLGGDDRYDGPAAATVRFWQSASVVLDLRGADVYGGDTPELAAPETRLSEAFSSDYAFRQGVGLFGVGLLVDAEGDDRYAASAWGQGSAFFGVGALQDLGGADEYRLGFSGQGQASWGIGLLHDGSGDDFYGVYTMGQGAGRTAGAGALLDGGGSDDYVAWYQEHEPNLPAEFAVKNYYGLDPSWPYSHTDEAGARFPHWLSIAQGVGWGYRHEWVGQGASESILFAGGLGALVDLGEGDDRHFADCMSMGQGFVYGLGLLYDGGGDDSYRTFWWGPAASAHMGVGVFIEAGGNDDIVVDWASGGFGYDNGVGWLIDLAGDDRYGGRMHYGRGYLTSTTVMLDLGGDDHYNYDGGRGSSPMFGYVQDSQSFSQKLLGAFLDLGAGQDVYETDVEGIGNDAVWHLPAQGSAAESLGKGIGIDR